MVRGVENNGSMYWNDEGAGYGVFSNTGNVFSMNQEGDDFSDFQSSEVAKCKRIRLSPEFNQQESDETYHEQSSSLGLTLTRTPSFMNQIDMLQEKLEERQNVRSTSKMNDFVSQPMSEKLKASNFSASLLKIGNWERICKHEGDLIAKCYYAKRKLVWEVLDGALKSKIEVQWSDIVAIRAIIRDHQPGVLEIELNQPPLFFREINPQPRKHTLWQQASDFTRGQASIWRRHYVRFPPGILDKHYEKLLQYDQRLYMLSQKPFPSQQSPYFDQLDVFGFSQLSFNDYGPQYLPGLQFPQRVHVHPTPLIPLQVHNFNLSTQAHGGGIMDSDSPMSVMDFANENASTYAFQHHRSMLRCQEQTDITGENYVQGLPSITSATQASLLFPIEDYHRLNSDEKILIPDEQLGVADPYHAESTNLLLPLESVNGGTLMMQPQISDSLMPYASLGSTEGDFSMLGIAAQGFNSRG